MISLPSHESLSAGERARIPGVRDALLHDARAWFKPVHALVPDKTFCVLSELLAAAAPLESIERLIHAMRFCAWMYLLDYFVDEIPGNSLDHLTELHSRVDAAMQVKKDLPDTPFLDASLTALCAELAKSEAAPALHALFLDQIRRELGASVALFKLPTHSAINVEDYLALAEQSVNHMSCSLSLALAIGEPIPPADGPQLLHALRPAARAVRLSNDLRTFSKDDAEGRPHALAFDWDKDSVGAAIHRALEEFDHRLAAFDGAPRTVAAVRRLTQLGVEIYGVTDIKLNL